MRPVALTKDPEQVPINASFPSSPGTRISMPRNTVRGIAFSMTSGDTSATEIQAFVATRAAVTSTMIRVLRSLIWIRSSSELHLGENPLEVWTFLLEDRPGGPQIDVVRDAVRE